MRLFGPLGILAWALHRTEMSETLMGGDSIAINTHCLRLTGTRLDGENVGFGVDQGFAAYSITYHAKPPAGTETVIDAW